ncbi:MAG: hypothetical protein KGZ64_06235 [Thermaerobacter sp.]|nr:hypothetical protein [Thermaerobacter sp.]
MESEKLQILKMVQEGKIRAEEAEKLLQALEQKGASALPSTNAKWLRVRVQEADKKIVNINLPMALVDVAVNMGLKFASPEQLDGIDVPALMQAIKQGATGKILEVQSEEATVEITVE